MARLPQSVLVACKRCNAESRHTVLTSIRDSSRETDSNIYYQIVECDSCKHLSFRRYFRNKSSRDFDISEIFPSRRPGIVEIDYSEVKLPTLLIGLYIETSSAVTDGFGTLAALGIRSLIEGICIYEGATGRTLDKKIDSLVQLGHLSKKQAESLHTLRHVGNAAAHEAAMLHIEQVTMAWKSLEMIILTLYFTDHLNSQLRKPA